MSAINDLLKQVQDPALRKRLEEEIAHLSKNKKFGLVFEDHIPECTRLYGVGVKPGSLVARRADTKIDNVWQVVQIEGEEAVCCKKGETSTVRIPVSDLVVVAQFGEPIYPYLEPVDAVCNAPDSNLWHTLIEADNYHALQLLEYLYAGQVDCIYIDPPYNTGARDWKYNNDYVDSSDSYRHSKWLSMMKKRLELAKKLLNPADSVLIVTIDEKEYLHLGCLLEEMFPSMEIQMVTDVINAKGVARANQFSRVEEYIYFVFIGDAQPSYSDDSMLDFEVTGNYVQNAGDSVPWARMLRRGSNSHREHSENCFYPIFVNESNGTIESVGFPPGKGNSRQSVITPNGCTAVWPMHKGDVEGCWQLSRSKFLQALENGTAKLGRKNKLGQWSINYLNQGLLNEIAEGSIVITGKDATGAVTLERKEAKLLAAKSVWTRKAHDASLYGSVLLSSIIEKRFSYPKSLYSERDTIRFFVANKPNALILDFFAGSGTTLHAVNLLNAEDGGHRRCIMVTNNEVSSDEEKTLRAQGWQPGDEAWEQYGIARYVTWPRTVCSIEGHDINGQPLKGNYLGSDRPMADGFAANCEYFRLGFMDKTRVSLGAQFREILPLLWLKTGAVGKRPEPIEDDIPDMMILPENGFAVLTDETQFASFVSALRNTDIDKVFFVTNSESAFREMSEAVEARQTWQLYRDYIDNFTIGARRTAQ